MFLRVASLFLILITLIILIFVGRVILNPLDVSFLRSEIDPIVSRFIPGWSLAYDKLILFWGWEKNGPALKITNITARHNNPSIAGNIGEIVIGFPVSSFSGSFNVGYLFLNDLKLVTTEETRTFLLNQLDKNSGNDFEGYFGTQIAAYQKDSTQEPREKTNIIKSLSRLSGKQFIPVVESAFALTDTLEDLFPSLDQVIFTHLQLDLAAANSLQSFHFKIPRFVVKKQKEQSRAILNADLFVANRRTGIEVDVTLDPAKGRIWTILDVNNIYLSNLVEPYGLPEDLKSVRIPIALELRSELDEIEGLKNASYTLDIGAGHLYDLNKFPDPAPITSGTLKGIYEINQNRIEIAQGHLDLNGTEIILNGKIQLDDIPSQENTLPASSGHLSLRTDVASISDILAYWPVTRTEEGLEKGGRSWMARNMIGGHAGNAVFNLDWSSSKQGPYTGGSFYELSFDFWDIDTYITPTMPPLLYASGRGYLTNSSLDIQIDKAEILDITVDDSRVFLDNIDRKSENTGYFHLHVSGDTRDVLEILDYPPIRLSQKINGSLDRFGGRADIYADISLPLIDNPDTEKIFYSVDGRLTNTSVRNILGGKGISGGDLNLQLDKNTLEISGSAFLNGLSADVHYIENLKSSRINPHEDTSKITLSFSSTVEQLSAFNLNFTRWATGSFEASAFFSGRNLALTKGYIEADLSQARVKIPELGWESTNSSLTRLTADITLADNETLLKRLDLSGKDIDVNLKGVFLKGDNAPFTLDATIRRLGHNSLSANIERFQDGNLKADIQASTLDLAPLLASRVEPDEMISDDQPISELDLDVEARTIKLLNGETLSNALFTAKFLNTGISQASGSARDINATGPSVLSLNISPDQNSLSSGSLLNLTSSDAGKLLRGFGFFSHLDGGNLNFEGNIKGWGPSLSIKATGNVGGGRVINSNMLSEKVTLGLIPDLSKLIDDEGLEITKIIAPLTYEQGLLDFTDMRANSLTLGITLEGQIHTQRKKININGVVVPAYELNSFLGKIPIVGGLFTGGKGKGLFAIPYRVKGDLKNPDVTVNAASGLVPGFLRLMFEGDKGTVESLDRDPKQDAEKIADKAPKIPESSPE